MHLTPAIFAVCCALQLQQAPAQEYSLYLINNTPYDFVQFNIRASDSGRPWTKVLLAPGVTKMISLVSKDPFDVEVWRWSGIGRWIVSRQSEMHLKKDSDGLHHIRMNRSFASASGDESDSYDVFTVFETRYGGKNKKLVEWRLESNPFRLIPR